MVILVTGAAGKTGQHVIRALARRGVIVRAFVGHEVSEQIVLDAGATEVVAGDFSEPSAAVAATRGVQGIYHICPNMHPAEVSIGRLWIDAAQAAGVEHFVYHSVLHPQVEAMPHHWHKLRVEEILFTCAMDWTIVQPTAYMQNILADWQSIVDEGVYTTPYPSSTALALVDLADVGEVAARVLTDPGHTGAIYELAGVPPLSQNAVAEALSKVLRRSVRAEEIALDVWIQRASDRGMDAYAIETLAEMFSYYAAHGLSGNPNVLTWLLDRPPTSLEECLQRIAGST